MSVQSRVSYSSRSAFVFANNHHIRTLDTTFDLTGCVRTGEAVSLVHGVHSDIKIARVYGRRCCVKIPRFVGDYSHQDSLREFRQRVIQEARIWSGLNHPNILPFVGFTTESSTSLCLISPMLEDGPASNFLQGHPLANRLEIVTGVAEGLLYLHERRVVHGDLKGANILISVTRFGIVPMICDFGSAHIVGTPFVGTAGTYRWTAKELLRLGLDDSDQPYIPTYASDVWSFGMTVLELYSGRVPFYNIVSTLRAVFHIQNGGLPPHPGAPAIERGLSDALWGLLESCWCSDPVSRPTTTSLVAQLRELRDAT
ncbi:hypothetical protein NLI96_g5132 [Meripilus lineatus]|uniref:Protein kinase domain-containing protein n=1 Tax=Meripilus lineatus TaxID=2056292 RepID=A0AAD5V8V4_9APHY|nr:hypothetical protein NLI96_g5132 [Physisporinus lineatus]